MKCRCARLSQFFSYRLDTSSKTLYIPSSNRYDRTLWRPCLPPGPNKPV